MSGAYLTVHTYHLSNETIRGLEKVSKLAEELAKEIEGLDYEKIQIGQSRECWLENLAETLGQLY